MLDQITVATINMKVQPADKVLNCRKVLEYTLTASQRGADIILFPEMCLTGYDCYISDQYSQKEKMEMAETPNSGFMKSMEKFSTQYKNYIIFGAAELDLETNKLYNSAFVCGPEGFVGSYRKIHPFADENKWCEKGDRPFLFDTPWGPVGIGICYDTYQFPELMRHYVYKGARLYLNPTALAEENDKQYSREAFLSYYSLLDYGVLCNTIYIASANLTGYDIDTYFGGGSCVLGPKVTPFFETQVTCYGGDKNNVEESLDITTIDLSLAKRRLCQVNEVSGEMDYRPDLYKTF